MYCPNCGADVGSSKFCTECGAPVTGNEIPATPQENKNGAAKGGFIKKHLKLIIIGIVILLIVISAVSRNAKKKKQEEEDSVYWSEFYSSRDAEDTDDSTEADWNNEATETEAPTTEAPVTEAPTMKPTGVDPDLKAFLDEYEAFIDDYVDFMEKYSGDSYNEISMLTDYTKMLARYNSFEEKMDKYDSKQDEMSDADLVYYLEAQARITAKLYSIDD